MVLNLLATILFEMLRRLDNEETALATLGRSTDTPNYVISAVLLHRIDGANHMLGGVRTDVDPRHQQVFSSITQSVPEKVFRDIVGHPDRWKPDTVEDLSKDSQTYRVGCGDHAMSLGTTVIECMLSRKVGLGNALTAGTFRGIARRTVGIARWVPDASTDEALYEIMGGLVITDLRGIEEIPERTSAYDPLVWVRADRVARAVAKNDALVLDPDLNRLSLMTCAGVGGSCMRLAVAAIERYAND